MYYLVVGAIIVLIILLIMSFSRSLSVARFAVSDFILTVVVCIGCFFFANISIDNRVQYEAEQNARCLSEISELLVDIDKVDFDDEETVKTLNQNITTILDKYGITEAARAIVNNGEEGYDIETSSGQTGMLLTGNNLPKELLSTIRKTIESKEVSYYIYSNEKILYTITDPEAVIGNRILCIETSISAKKSMISKFVNTYSLYVLAGWGICNVLLLIISLAQRAEFNRIVNVMVKASTTGEIVRKPVLRSEEMGVMWNALEVLSKKTAKDNYERFQVLQAYYRFSPKKIETILDKASIKEVESGNSVEKIGTFALSASYWNKRKQSQTEQIEIEKLKFSVLSENQKDGVIVSSDGELNFLKYLFMDNKKGAVEFAYNSLLALNATKYISNENVIILLHNARYIYGVTGDDNQSIPFMKSEDVSILQRYLGSLASLGIKMVVTENMLDSLESGTKYRYIGYVGKDNNSFKLYEITDVYPETERILRVRTEQKLEQGISLFYKDDFYLARNAFTDVLKECPEDGIAKWYLFTCEYRLNHPDDENVSYGLFSEE